MGMRDYAVDDWGLVFDEDTIKIVAENALEYFDELEEDDALDYELYNAGICEYISEFTGEAILVNENGNVDFNDSIDYSCDTICYVPVTKWPTIFKGAYKDMDDLIADMKERVGEYLPEDYDYRSNVRKITGTYYG